MLKFQFSKLFLGGQTCFRIIICTFSFRCWWGYNLTHYFWILEGPRLGVIVVSTTNLILNWSLIYHNTKTNFIDIIFTHEKIALLRLIYSPIFLIYCILFNLLFFSEKKISFFTLQLNFMFLLNIIRVLVVKLRQSHTSEIEQVRYVVEFLWVNLH